MHECVHVLNITLLLLNDRPFFFMIIFHNNVPPRERECDIDVRRPEHLFYLPFYVDTNTRPAIFIARGYVVVSAAGCSSSHLMNNINNKQQLCTRNATKSNVLSI